MRLTPGQRAAMAPLLAGKSRKDGAAELGISLRAYHNRLLGIYAAYGVHSQAELLALFAGRRPRREPADWVLYG